MIDAREIMRAAVTGGPLSIKDDPTAFAADPVDNLVTRDDVQRVLVDTAKDNALSALAQAFGREAERIGTLMDGAIAEDGPLADLDGIWAAEIQGVRPRLPDLSSIAAAPDWESRIEALRAVMADVVEAMVTTEQLAEPAAAQLDTLISLDPRLAHLADADFTPPAFVTGRDPLANVASDEPDWDGEYDTDEQAGLDQWDDESTPAPVETGRRGRGKRNGKPVPKLCALLETAGFQDKEIAAIMGIDKSTYSLMRSGKRPWQGLRDDVAAKLHREVSGRQFALSEAMLGIDDPEVRKPDGA